MTTQTTNDTLFETAPDPRELAMLGEGQIAYVRPVDAAQIRTLFPQAPELQPGTTLFALLSASGTPILVAGTRDAAEATAWANDLRTVSLH